MRVSALGVRRGARVDVGVDGAVGGERDGLHHRCRGGCDSKARAAKDAVSEVRSPLYHSYPISSAMRYIATKSTVIAL